VQALGASFSNCGGSLYICNYHLSMLTGSHKLWVMKTLTLNPNPKPKFDTDSG